MSIDADQQPAAASQWGVRSYPTIKFAKANGDLLHEFAGYKPLPDFLMEMNRARSLAAQ